MQTKRLEQRSLQRLEGFWKVVYHGSLQDFSSKESVPRLSVLFGKLANQSNPSSATDFRTVGEPVAIPLPIGELMRLPINVVVKDCRLAFDPKTPLPSEKLGSFNLDFRPSNIRLIDRFAQAEDGRFLIPLREGKTPTPDDGRAKSYYIAVGSDGNPYSWMIPCSEVFRFFYCTSSRMASTILSARILEPNRYIINPAHTNVDKHNPRIAAVWLRRWMLNQDRRHIARLFFTPGAFEEAANIFLRAAGQCDEYGRRFERSLVAYPPVRDEINLKLIYRESMVDGFPSCFVTRILVSDWAMDFDAIHFSRDNDNERVATDKEREALEEQKRQGSQAVAKVGTEITALFDSGVDKSIAEIELTDTDFAARFPELDKIPSPKIPKIDQSSKSNDDRRRVDVAGGSVLEFGEEGQKKIVSTILLANKKLEEINKSKDEMTKPLVDVPPMSGSNLDMIIALLNEAEVKQELKVEYLPVMEDVVIYRKKTLNRLPRSFDDKSPPWFFIDAEKNEPRLVLVAALRFQGQLRYLIEFMHTDNATSDCSMLVLWDEHGGFLPSMILRFAIESCMRHKSASLAGCVEVSFCSGCRLKHGEGIFDNYETFLHKVFVHAQNKMPQLIDPVSKRKNC